VLSKSALKKSGGRVKAVVVNAGCANAVTGNEGLAAAKRVRTRAAELLRCEENEIFLASTGVIGVVLPDKKVRESLPDAITRLSPGGVDALSHAILTTDVGPKVAQATFTLGGKRGRLVGVAKGAGMIHPNMATMLAFVMTDANLSAATLQKSLRLAVDVSFNAISVDGDTSTNDTVLLLASNQLPAARDIADFQRALNKVCRDLAWMIVRDGEGATRVAEVRVEGARVESDADRIARTVAESPLVKTALNGGDPNWGRVLAAVGRAGVELDMSRVDLFLGDVWVAEGGRARAYDEARARAALAEDPIRIRVHLKEGRASGWMWTCDLSHGYVDINAHYRS